LAAGDASPEPCATHVDVWPRAWPPEPYDLSHPEVAAHLRPIFSLRGFTLPNKQVVLRALDLYSRYHFLDFGDCRIVAGMRLRGIRSLYFYDAGFDKPPEFETGKLYLLPASPQAGRGIFCGISRGGALTSSQLG